MNIRKMAVALSAVAIGSLATGGAARADTILYIDDTGGNIGKVDITTHSVSSVHNSGQALTDIGFTSSGALYGTTYSGLYSINTTSFLATSVGSYGGVGGGGMNALVGNGAGGLLAASNATSTIYNVNLASPAGTTGSATYHSPVASAGDLAFAGPTLYESGIAGGGGDELINATLDSVVGMFKVNGVGPALTGVFGLADDGTTMYAVNGQNIYSVNLSTASLTFLFTYGGGLGAANGTAFFGEGPVAAPEPASLMLFGSGLAGLLLLRRRKMT